MRKRQLGLFRSCFLCEELPTDCWGLCRAGCISSVRKTSGFTCLAAILSDGTSCRAFFMAAKYHCSLVSWGPGSRSFLGSSSVPLRVILGAGEMICSCALRNSFWLCPGFIFSLRFALSCLLQLVRFRPFFSLSEYSVRWDGRVLDTWFAE